MPSRKNLILLFFALFLFRLFFGLCQSNWQNYDEKQSYLTGLKFYTTGEWPFFGPDAAGSESAFYSQIPGAMEGLVIGIPLYLLPLPESPFILVNLLSVAGVLLLAWYIFKRIPGFSFVWLSLWIGIVPWGLHYPSHISNMSYLFFSGILFIIGFLESVPLFSLRLIPLPWANALMGFSFFWTMQFHLSYVFLAPLVLFSLVFQTFKNRDKTFFTAKTPSSPRKAKNKNVKTMFEKLFSFFSWRTWRLGGKSWFFFILGSLPPLSLAIPTYLHYGFQRINSHSGFATAFNWDNVLNLYLLLPRFLSLACYEIPSYLGAHNADRFAFLNEHPWLWVPGSVLWIGGLFQAVILFLYWFRKNQGAAGWRETKWLLLGVFSFVYGCFWFTIKAPLSHIYMVLFPLVMIYSCNVWMFFRGIPRAGLMGKVFVVLAVLFQLGYAIAVAPKDSIEVQRDLVLRAIREKNYHLVGERSPGSLY